MCVPVPDFFHFFYYRGEIDISDGPSFSDPPATTLRFNLLCQIASSEAGCAKRCLQKCFDWLDERFLGKNFTGWRGQLEASWSSQMKNFRQKRSSQLK